MGIILFLVARILQWILSPLFFIYAIITSGSLKKLSDYFHNVAFGIDQLGNAMGGPIMNHLLLKDSSKYPYGDVDMTISHVTGVNYLSGNLTWLGRLIAKILNKIDKNHVQNAAQNEQ